MASIPSYLLGITCLLLPSLALGQPGATPPGSVPPYSPAPAPYPAPAPAPAPYPAPAPAPAPGPNYGPNYGPAQPPLPPAQNAKRGRSGWNVGASFSGGSMSSSAGDLECQGCDTTPPAVGGEFHIGTMVMPKLALQAEFSYMTRDLDVNGDASLNQSMALIAGQYWVSPRFWIKAGFGFASLSLTYFDGFQNVDESLESGSGIMAAMGYEIVQSGGFALDVQLKYNQGNYSDRNEDISTTALALGVNWY
jgi:hypothetical protein